MLPTRLIVIACVLGFLIVGSGAGRAPRGGGPPWIVAHRGAMTQRPECTLSAIRRAIELGAHVVELDVRLSKDGVPFILHDATLDRTTNGSGPAGRLTMKQLKQLDAGSHFDPKYRGERIPTLAEALALCRGRIDVLLDLKEQGAFYAQCVAHVVGLHGDPRRTILGVRSVEQAQRFGRLLPECRRLGFIVRPGEIEAFSRAGVEIIRLWPSWLSSPEGDRILKTLREHDLKLQLNVKTGRLREVLPLVRYRPEFLLADDPAALRDTLEQVRRVRPLLAELDGLVRVESVPEVVPWVARPGALSFLNRDYHMLQLPRELQELPRLLFHGGQGDRLRVRFLQPAVVFAAFEYNATGAWSFPDNLPPEAFGWKRMRSNGYRGTSNSQRGDKPHFAHVYYRLFPAGTRLEDTPPWWVCLGVVGIKKAQEITNLNLNKIDKVSTGPFLYSRWAGKPRFLNVPEFHNLRQWSNWQEAMREKFRRRLVFRYDHPLEIRQVGRVVDRGSFLQHEFHAFGNRRLLFRFFKLIPKATDAAKSKRLPTVVCFMGHGKVSQILSQRESYQHACAARFAEQGYLVFAMENVGMEPERDRHLELDRLLRLDGYGWYSLLFAHQLVLLDHVFADPQVDPRRVGTTGVSTGGLLALSAIALDRRVRAASVQGIFGSMRVSFVQDRKRHCSCGAIPGLLPEFDLPELALLAAPRPLHISNATQDSFTPAEALRCVRLIAPWYRKIGGPPLLFTSPPGRHEYAFEPALRFFESTIGKPE